MRTAMKTKSSVIDRAPTAPRLKVFEIPPNTTITAIEQYRLNGKLRSILTTRTDVDGSVHSEDNPIDVSESVVNQTVTETSEKDGVTRTTVTDYLNAVYAPFGGHITIITEDGRTVSVYGEIHGPGINIIRHEIDRDTPRGMDHFRLGIVEKIKRLWLAENDRHTNA